jgi:hypothetical protein
VNLIISSRRRLREVYGAGGTRRVAAALRRRLAARAAWAASSRIMWVEEGLKEFGIAGVEIEALAIAHQIGELAAVLERSGEQLHSVLIAGGPEIVPFYLAPNPTLYDGDDDVATDTCYGARDPFALMAEWPVGRLPGGAGDKPDLLVQLLEQTGGYRWTPAAPLPKPFGYSTEAWRRASSIVYAEIPGSGELLVSPPLLAATLDRGRLDRAGRIYCNLHGVRDGALWYGQPSDRSALLVALRPSDLEGLELHGAVAMSEACYGAAIAGRDERSSMALAFLSRGAIGFVGATAVSYGPASPPGGEADLIALHFWRELRTPGTTLGAAFLAARAGMLRDTLRYQATLDEDDQKTLLEFVLYGDPTLVVS